MKEGSIDKPLPDNKEETKMKHEKNVAKQKTFSVCFAVEEKNGVVTRIGTSSYYASKPNFKGGGIKWYDDAKLVRNK